MMQPRRTIATFQISTPGRGTVKGKGVRFTYLVYAGGVEESGEGSGPSADEEGGDAEGFDRHQRISSTKAPPAGSDAGGQLGGASTGPPPKPIT